MKIIFLLFTLLVSQLAVADALLLFETTNPRTPDTIEIKNSKIRLSNKADPVITLFDYSKKKLTFLNQDDKTYYQITEKGLKKVVKKIKQLQKDMKKGLNTEQQAQLDKVFARQGLSFNATAGLRTTKKLKSSSVKGIDCDIYVSLLNEEVQGTHCIASGRYMGINSADFRTYLHLMYFLKKISFGLSNVDPAMQNGFTGMPLVSYDAQGKLVRKFISVRALNIDKGIFAIPEDYRRVGSP